MAVIFCLSVLTVGPLLQFLAVVVLAAVASAAEKKEDLKSSASHVSYGSG